ncbi:MAG: hypothetical protein U9Q21_03360, partial [Candidatus Auribacterota bacterium]|nr:hypothetical protein [Candidatus Auribacterota bacterium]
REVSSSINAYSCLKVANCFETAFCGNSSNCLFCYDGSNLDNCMFCFSDNAKKYAIGNLEVGKKRFFELKNIVVDELFQELEKNKSLKMNIFNLLKM